MITCKIPGISKLPMCIVQNSLVEMFRYDISTTLYMLIQAYEISNIIKSTRMNNFCGQSKLLNQTNNFNNVF